MVEIVMPDTIRGWTERAAKDDAYMIVWCDTFDYGHYPSFYKNEEQAQFALDYPQSMEWAMEVYDLKNDLEKQLKTSHRVWALKPSYL